MHKMFVRPECTQEIDFAVPADCELEFYLFPKAFCLDGARIASPFSPTVDELTS